MSDGYLSTGVPTFNLQLTNDINKGLKKGTYAFFVGDSSAGKSFLATTIAAQAAIDDEFSDYKIYYDDVENGALFDLESLFSKRVADRVQEPPNGISTFIDDFYLNASKAMEAGPCIYILDSENGLTTKEEESKFQDLVKAVDKAGGDTAKALKNLTGQMADGKAKKHSQNLRRLVGLVEQTESILVIVGQTRDDLTGYAKDGIVYSGGRALKYYAHIMAHLALKARLKKTVNNTARDIGVRSEFKLIKNRYSGKRSETNCPIYYTSGYDAIGGMIDWLVDEGVWSSGTSLDTKGFFDAKLRRETAISRIDEDDELLAKLHSLVQKTWDEIYKKCEVSRKNRYE